MNKEQELRALVSRSTFILEYMGNIMNNKPYFQRYIDVLNEHLQRGNLKGIRIASKDTDAWAKDLPQQDLYELDRQLKQKFGEGLLGKTSFNKKVHSILKIGKINNLKEFELIHNLTQDLAEGDELFEYMEQMQGLLAAYMRDNP